MRFFLSLSRACLLAAALLVSSCGSDDASPTAPSAEGTIGATPFLLVSESGLTFADGTLRGTGSAVAKDPLGEIKAGKSLAVAFTLEEGGSLAIKSFASNALEGGVVMTLSRKGKVLSAGLEAAGKTVDVSKTFAALDASTEVSVLLDVHNDETPAHVLAWKGDVAAPSDANALFNSEKAGDGTSPGNGKGTFWGLTLSKATVKKAVAAEAKFEHE